MTTQPPPPGIAESLEAVGGMLNALRQRTVLLATITQQVASTLTVGGRVLACGNGGSAAESLHLVEELVGRYRIARRALPAICLCADPTALTCIANDYGYDEVFARQVEAHGRAGDLFIALSTSGRSPSIVRALERARGNGLVTLGLLGPSGSAAQAYCDIALTLDGVPAARIQEAHLIVIHLILDQIDYAFAAGPGTG